MSARGEGAADVVRADPVTPAPGPARRAALGWALRAAITCVFAVILLRLVDVRAVARVLAGADWRLVAAAVGVGLVDRVLMIGKWYPLLRIQAPSVGLWRAARAYLVGNFAGFFLPSTVGPDVVRAIALGRDRSLVPE